MCDSRRSVRVYDTSIRVCVLAGGGNIAFALVGQAAKYTRDNVYPLAGTHGRSCIMLIQCKSSREPREESKAEAASQERSNHYYRVLYVCKSVCTCALYCIYLISIKFLQCVTSSSKTDIAIHAYISDITHMK